MSCSRNSSDDMVKPKSLECINHVFLLYEFFFCWIDLANSVQKLCGNTSLSLKYIKTRFKIDASDMKFIQGVIFYNRKVI